MNTMKKIEKAVFILLAVFCTAMFYTCNGEEQPLLINNDPPPAIPFVPRPFNPPGTGTWVGTGNSQVFAAIGITITLEEGWIANVEADTPDENHDIELILSQLVPFIKEYNTFNLLELVPDSLAGVDHVYWGINEAGNNAIADILKQWEEGILSQARWLAILDAIDEDPDFDGVLDLSHYRRPTGVAVTGPLFGGIFDPMLPGVNISAIERISTLILPDEAVGIVEGRGPSMSIPSIPTSPPPPLYPFSAFSNLREIKGRNITRIGGYAFQGLANLVSADFPKVTSIGEMAFAECSSLSSVSFPELTEVRLATFFHCENLTTVYLPRVTRIHFLAFYYCNSLTSVYIPDITNIYNAFYAYSTVLPDLAITMGSIAPNVGIGIFGNMSHLPRTVTVIVPAGATGYGTSPTDTTTENWGNTLRGLRILPNDPIFAREADGNINLIIEYQPL